MKVTITKDFRTLKAGDIYEFDQYTVLVGENGSGKTSLLQAIRGKLEDPTNNECDFNHQDRKILSENILVESSYDKIFVFDTTNDKGDSMNNGCDAYTWVHSGGYATKNLSNGQVSQHYAVDIFEKIKKYREQNPKSKILVILDELDTGFSLKYQNGYPMFCHTLRHTFKCDLIVTSHSFLFLNSVKKVYDITTKELMDSDSYFKKIGII